MNKKNVSIGLVIILHLVGAVGTIIPETAPYFLALTPLNLVLSSILLFITDDSSFKKILPVFLFTFLIGYCVEVLGVKTGVIFGEYVYGEPLGFKLFEVPLTIGLNWFMLTYIFHHLFLSVKSNVLSAVLAAFFMTLTDVLIEPVAISLDYWSWAEVSVPLANYIAWFAISLFLHLIIRYRFKSQAINPLAPYLLAAQVQYFLVILLFG